MTLRYQAYLIVLFIITALTGCFKQDEMIIPRDINEIRIPYSLYEYQVYYKISTESIIQADYYDGWDLGFESSEDGFHIILNSSKNMYVGESGSTDFYSVTSNSADTMKYDDSSGDLSKAVLNSWINMDSPGDTVITGNVFIIDRGMDESGVSFGYVKLVIEDFDNDTYYVRFSNLDGTDENTYQVHKDPSVNFVLFSFDNGGNTLVSEPPSESWDLCFTKYSTVIPDDFGVPTPYVVRGVLLNQQGGLMAVTDTINSYYDIGLDNIPGYAFSGLRDAIGYKWKIFRDDAYSLVEDISYVVRDQTGEYYKIRFTDYFNKAGQRGYPAFEQIKLIN